MARWKAVLLDIDGTLVDSNDAHAHAWVDVLSEAGFRVSFERVRKLIGKGGDKMLPELTGLAKDSPQGEEIGQSRAQRFRERYLPQVRAFPHARELLERMHADGLRLVAATSAQKDEMKALLDITGAAHLFYQSVTGSEAPSKPDAGIIELALRKAGAEPDEAIMLGDTPYDVEASRKADVIVVALRCGGWSDDALKGAAELYDDPANLLAQYDRSLFIAKPGSN